MSNKKYHPKCNNAFKANSSPSSIKRLAFSFFIFILILGFALASTSISRPHGFYGTAYGNGVIISSGIVVSAVLNGVMFNVTVGNNGQYGYSPSLIVTSDSGGTVTFYIDGTLANQQVTFSAFAVTNLDLTINRTISGGCTESWVCSDWTACVGNVQTRTCTDSNNCGTIISKPSESQSCGTITTTTTGGGGGGGGSSSHPYPDDTYCKNGICGLENIITNLDNNSVTINTDNKKVSEITGASIMDGKMSKVLEVFGIIGITAILVVLLLVLLVLIKRKK